MNKRTLLRNLAKAAEWIADMERNHDEAVNIVVGCFRILEQAGQRRVTDWLDRKPDRRRILGNIRELYLTPKGNKVLRDLISLTISAVESCTWVDDWLPGALPVQTAPRRSLTPEQMEKMREGKARKKASLEEARERRNRQN